MLHYSFTEHIWPRCEILRDLGMKNFDLVEVLTSTEEEFCKKFEIKKQDLKEKKAKKKYIEEKD